MNDETPTFKSASYVAEIGENSPRATPILFLGGNVVPEVFDYDSGTNGTFQLFLEGDQGIFEVRKTFFKHFLQVSKSQFFSSNMNSHFSNGSNVSVLRNL